MMPWKTYRAKVKKEIKAMQFLDKDSAAEIIRMTTGIREEKTVDPANGSLVPILIIQVYESEVQAALGDWVAIDSNGVPYPIKPEVFEAGYEEVTAEIPQ